MINPLVKQHEPVLRTHESAAQIARIVAGCILLFYLFPLMVVVAIWIRCDSRGPAFERCIGPDGRRLGLLKFRTTPHDEPGWSARNHRTRAGALLHYTRLEYLPNLVSVVRGEIRLAEFWRITMSD
jgi:lipopolysaccharide/colanic/teichoic acid biosynthesis glycosyltransferase